MTTVEGKMKGVQPTRGAYVSHHTLVCQRQKNSRWQLDPRKRQRTNLDSPQYQAKHRPTTRTNTISVTLPKPVHERETHDVHMRWGRGLRNSVWGHGVHHACSTLLAKPVGICACTRTAIPPHPPMCNRLVSAHPRSGAAQKHDHYYAKRNRLATGSSLRMGHM